MKLTADMFDFEKYEYFDSSTPKDGEWWDDQEKLWKKAGGWWGPSAMLYGLCRKPRTPKPPPRYILLNEGEKLQEGDEFFAYDGIHPRMWHEMPGRTNDVQKREVWRRKVQ